MKQTSFKNNCMETDLGRETSHFTSFQTATSVQTLQGTSCRANSSSHCSDFSLIKKSTALKNETSLLPMKMKVKVKMTDPGLLGTILLKSNIISNYFMLGASLSDRTVC